MSELRLPELGEGIESVDVSAVLVHVGDFVRRDQPVIEVETEKASVEVPAAEEGRVTSLRVKPGDQLKVGAVILVVEGGGGDGDGDGAVAKAGGDGGKAAGGSRAAQAGEASAAPKRAGQKAAAGDDHGSAKADGAPRATGDAASADATATSKQHGRRAASASAPSPDGPSGPGAAATADDQHAARGDAATRESTRESTQESTQEAFDAGGERPAVGPRGARPTLGPTAPAAPSARALARELGVDVAKVEGSGPGGRISRDDVKAHAKKMIRGLGGASGGAPVAPPLPDFTKWGAVHREPLTGVRRATAKGMAVAWSTVPHVTQFDHADITQLESMRKRFNRRPDPGPRTLSMTAIAVKMVASALKQFPRFNASLDLEGDAIVYKDYVHIGVAVDTDRGLLVPVLRDVDRKGLVEISIELAELAERARARKLTPDEMRGAGFTVSNLGGLGTTYFSPIVNWPEVAILGVGRAEQRAVFDEGQFQPRLMLPLSLSYDHRIIDGADAARFLRRVAEALEQPLLLLLDE